MKKIYLGIISGALMILTSCEKELDMNYRSIEPLYVVEGMINQEATAVMVTMTRDMEDTGIAPPVGDLTVRLTDDDGHSETLVFNNGYYRSTAGTKGVPGRTYTLSVADSQDEFTSVCSMYAAGKMGNISYVYLPELSEKHLICSVSIEDEAGINNYYCLRLKKNGKNNLRQIFTDKGNDGGNIPITIPIRFSFGEQPPPEEGKDEDHVFRKGDLLEMELQTIDRQVYDYIYSLDLSGNISFNPTDTFSGNCLGYFSAYSSTVYSIVFDPGELLPGFRQ